MKLFTPFTSPRILGLSSN
jgi:hypothetical protein